MKLNDRQRLIIDFAKNNTDFQTKDVVLFFGDKF